MLHDWFTILGHVYGVFSSLAVDSVSLLLFWYTTYVVDYCLLLRMLASYLARSLGMFLLTAWDAHFHSHTLRSPESILTYMHAKGLGTASGLSRHITT
jgi:hypothetical protein